MKADQITNSHQTQIELTLNVPDMSCPSCEGKIENSVGKMGGVAGVKASYRKSTVIVRFEPGSIQEGEIVQGIEQLGYSISSAGTKRGDKKWKQVLGFGIIIAAIYLIFQRSGLLSLLPEVPQYMGFGFLFVIGLVTSLHCIAMCGGINLSQSVARDVPQEGSTFRRAAPALLYNSGRVISYTVIGGLVGAVGSVVSFSGTARGFVVIIAGVFMFLLGINFLDILPWFRRFNLVMPKFLSGKINKSRFSKVPFMVGLLNGFMPCGPLQSMQLYALGTGTFISGALSMLFFSVGTVPLMFGFGAVSSLLAKRHTQKIFRLSGLLVMVLAVVMVGRGLNLTGVSFTGLRSARALQKTASVAEVRGDFQTVTTSLQSNRYEPLIVQRGIPVRWTLLAEEERLNGCNNTLTVPAYDLTKSLSVGENLIEFTPLEAGTVTFTCWMGMITSVIKVVEDLTQLRRSEVREVGAQVTDAGSWIQEEDIGLAELSEGAREGEGVQAADTAVQPDRFAPVVMVVQRDVMVRWNLTVDELDPENDLVLFPEYKTVFKTSSGKTVSLYHTLERGDNILEFVPRADFLYKSKSGFIGLIKVVDRLSRVNIEKITEESQAYIPQLGGCCLYNAIQE